MDRQHALNRRFSHRPAGAPGSRIDTLLAVLVAELEADGIPAPLGQPFTLGAVWAALRRLAGEGPSPAARRLQDEPVAA